MAASPPVATRGLALDLEGRTALVVGASRGAGRRVAERLAAEGARVLGLARDAAALGTLEAAVRAAGGEARAVVADLTGPRDVLRAALDAGREALGPPTVVVLAAATRFRYEKLGYLDDATTDELLRADLTALVDVVRWALGGMVDARFGRVVVVGSLTARMATPGGALYGAAKAGLEGLVRGLAADYGPRGVTANTVAVGPLDGERLRERTGADPAARAALERRTATRRLVTEDDVADLVLFLASPRAAALTGATLDLTAGAHLGLA